MFLNYLALVMILIVLVIIFYAFIYIHELPYEAAKHRNHPHQDAIYVACWISLFTLHAIWPLVFIWAMTHKEPAQEANAEVGTAPSTDLALRLAQLENRLLRIEQQGGLSANAQADGAKPAGAVAASSKHASAPVAKGKHKS